MKTEFTFAGFAFPRYIVELDRRAKPGARVRAVYYHAPKPITGGAHPGQGFYLENHGAPSLRWQWADEVKDARIRHSGWYSDDEHCGELIRGIVFRLPHGRGFLAGWSMGEGMISELDGDIYAEEREAALAADQIAERVAEKEREYQAEQRAELEAEEQAEEERRAAMRQCFC